MKHLISIVLLFVIGLASCRELKTKKPDISHVEDAKLTNDVAGKPAVAGSDVATNAMTGRKLRHLMKRSRSRYGGSSSDSDSSSSSSSDSDSSSTSSSDSDSSSGSSSRSRSRYDERRSRYDERRSRYDGGSYESYYGNSRHGYGQIHGSIQDGHVPYRSSRFPTYGSRHIGVRRYGSRPVSTNSISVNEKPKIEDCDCPFSRHNEPVVESQEYDFEFLRQWQRAFSSHPCCRQRWEAYSLNSK